MKVRSLLAALLLLSGSAFAQAPSNPVTIAIGDARYCKLAGCTMVGDLKFTDGLYDIGKSGATRPRDGFFSRDLTTGGNITLGGGSRLTWNTFSRMISSTDGIITLFNNAETGFTRLNFGGTTSSFAGLTGGGTTIRAILADNSGSASLRALGFTVDSSASMISSSTPWNNGAAAATGTLLNAPVAGNPTKWIPINDSGTTRYIPAW